MQQDDRLPKSFSIKFHSQFVVRLQRDDPPSNTMWNVLDWWSILETSDDRRNTREIIVVPFRSIDSPLLMALTLTEASSKLWLIGVRDQPNPKHNPNNRNISSTPQRKRHTHHEARDDGLVGSNRSILTM